ncbi:DNA helicase UvrD [Candidatus Pacearchaeota archaeon]|nr:DNA helicase UvrD [Candidatus Pacearchaeota archaeon]
MDKNWFFADLHIHSRFSRACSKALTIPNLVKWARVKGISLLGTGDFTHDVWLNELKELRPEKGILWYKDDKGEFPFILSSEISLVYTEDGKGRRVHLLYLAPNLDAVDKINAWLDGIGRRDYDGRPIFKISCRDFTAKMQEIDEQIEVIPAHIWTPWFGVFGSKGGYDSLTQAFKDKRDRIHAIETGISSDPPMNWKIKDLENISIVSFSDSHSFWPWRLGREATIFKIESTEMLSYDLMINQIRNNSFIGTIETDPAYGMYHFDGHRNCNFSCSPQKTRELGSVCPKCNKPLTVGVDYRVEELSNNDADNKNQKLFYRLLPLHEIISLAVGAGMNTKRVWSIYDSLIRTFKTEFKVLLDASKEELLRVVEDSLLVNLILKNRIGQIKVEPGYDGTYGKALMEESDEESFDQETQKTLF